MINTIAVQGYRSLRELRVPLGTITVAQVVAEQDSVRRGRATLAWTHDLWAAYRPQHDLVRGWLDDLGTASDQ